MSLRKAPMSSLVT